MVEVKRTDGDIDKHEAANHLVVDDGGNLLVKGPRKGYTSVVTMAVYATGTWMKAVVSDAD